MSPLRTALALAALSLGAAAQTATASFDLHQVWLDPDQYSGPQLLTGSFDWTYQVGDFENGSGQFTSLDLPWVAWGIADLVITIETKSIELVLPGSYHDKGVDISLKLVGELDPDHPVQIDLALSKFEIQQGIVYQGPVTGGEVAPPHTKPATYGAGTPGTGGLVPTLGYDGGLAHLGSTFHLDGASALPGAACFLLQGFGQTAVPVLGFDLLVAPAGMSLLPGVASGAGEVNWSLPIPTDLAFVGLEVDLQLAVLDAGSPGGLVAASAGLTTLLHP